MSRSSTSSTSSLEYFHNLHEGEACLLLCNGPSLLDLPLDFLNSYPSFGCNTIHLAPDGLNLTYYVAVDSKVFKEFGDAVLERFADTPKFIPTPNLDKWQGPNFYRWYHRPGPLWPRANLPLWPSNMLSAPGITYLCVPHVMMQLAFFMGFKLILVVGMDHVYHKAHFWGVYENIPNTDSVEWWRMCDKGNLEIYEGLKSCGVKMVNLSPGSNAEAIPTDDWKNYVKKRTKEV